MAQAPTFKLRQLSLSIALCTGAAATGVLAPVMPAMANPSGASVAHGAATFMQDGGLLQIDNSPGAIINWSSFSVAQDEITRFQQQSAQSAVLNRVTGGEISEIFGQLLSNGHVFLINPNGMVFGQNATIDTAGFVASTLDITNQDFLDGNYRFAGDSGRIINEGYLTTRSGNVYFVAPDIENAGIIHAESGALVLAAGRSIRIGSLDAPDIQFEITAPDDSIINLGQLLADQGSIHAFAGALTHSGAISASGAALAEDGSVILYAEGDIDLRAGSTISASGATGGDILVQSSTGSVLSGGTILAEGGSGHGGRIRLLGDRVGLLGQARVSAEGSGDGGEILIGGNVTGLGPEPNAKAVFIGTDTRVSASSTDSGDGGTIIAYANDLNRSYGTLTARGGPNGGDGGFIETSAAFIEVTRTPDAGASNGAPGQWLIDPDLLVIGEDDLVEVTEQDFEGLSIFTADPEAQAPTIQNTLIENAINSGTSVWVQTAFETAGSIRILAPLTFNATESGLVLNFFVDTGPDDNIFVEAPIINTGPESLEYGFIIGPGLVDFGADVDTGGLGDGLIIINSGQGANAIFSADVTLRGNLRTFFGGANIDGFSVLVDGDASLDALTLQNDASLTVNGTLSVNPFQGSGALVMSSANLFVTDEVEVGSALITGSSVTVGNFLSVASNLAIDTSTVEVGGLDLGFGSIAGSDVSISGDLYAVLDLTIDGSNVNVGGIMDMAQGSISSSIVNVGSFVFVEEALDISNVSTVIIDGVTLVDTLTLNNSTLQLSDDLLANSIDVVDGTLLGAETLVNTLSFNSSGSSSEVLLADLSVGDLTISGGTFAIDGIADISRLTFSDGTLRGIGEFSVTERMDWTGGGIGRSDSSGTLSIGSLAVLDIVGSGDKFLRGDWTLENLGEVNWFDGDVLLFNNAQILNLGVFTAFLTGGQQSLVGGVDNLLLNSAGGQFVVDSGAGTLTSSVTTLNDGIMTINNGLTRLLRASSTVEGRFWRIGEGSTLRLEGGFHTAESGVSFEGLGTLQVDPAATLAAVHGSIIVDNLFLNGGTLGGDGQLIVTSRMDWSGGSVGTVGSSGTLAINSALLDISGPSDKFLRGDWLLLNDGFMEWNAGDIVLGETARLFNRATLNANLVDGNLSIVAAGGSPLFTHGGVATLNLSGNANILTVDTPNRMFGNINVLEGELRFLRGATQEANYFIETGALVNFAGSDLKNWADGIAFSGNGFVEVSGGFVLVTAETVALENLRFSGGTISGNGDLLVANNMNWSAGTLGGEGVTGSLEIGQEATLDISGIVVGLNDWRLTNLGQVNWFGGNIDFNNSALIENFGEFNAFLTDGSAFLFQGIGDGGRFDNHGQLLVAPGAGDLLSGVFINNFGDIQVDNEVTRLLFDSMTFSEGGSWSIGEGSTLWLEFGVHVAESGVSFSGPGTLGVDPNATLAANDGPVFVDNLFLNGGIVVGPGGMHVGNSFRWRSGTVDSSTLTLESGGQALFSTEGLKILNFGLIQLGAETNTVWSGGEIRLVDEAVIEAAGDFFVRTDSNITSPDESGYFDNTGSMTKDTTTGTTRFQTRFDNNGTMTALSGTISLERDGTHFGDFFVLPPAEIIFVGNHDLFGGFENLGDQIFADAVMTIEGEFIAGNVIIRDFSDITFNGTYTAASTSILNNSIANFLFAASTGDLTVDSSSDIQGPGTLRVTGNAMLDALSLTRQGNTVFDSSSTLIADTLSLTGPGTLSLNGMASLGSLSVQGSQVSVGGNLTAGALVIDSGTFTGPGTTLVTGNLTLRNSGVLNGSGDVSVAGIFDWTGGLLSGTGLLDIVPGGSLISTSGASLVMQDRTLRNRSDIGISIDRTVGLTLNGTAVLDNQGRMRVEQQNGLAGNFGGNGVILNSGSFEGGGFDIANRFDNSGVVSVTFANLRLFGGGTHSGTFLIGIDDSTTPAGLQFAGTHTLDATSAIEGQSLFLPSGTATLNGTVNLDRLSTRFGHVILNSDADLNELIVAGSTAMLTGTGNISVANLFRWNEGTIGGSGTVTVAATAESQFGLFANPDPLRTLSGRTLTIADPDARLDLGRLQIIDGGVFENRGGFTFAFQDGTPFTIEGGADGTFRNLGSVTATSDLIFGTNTENSGSLQAPNLELADGMTFNQNGGSVITSGTFDVRGTLTQQAGTLSAETIHFPTGSNAILAGSLAATAAEISGGSLNVGGSATFGNLDLNAGSLSGAGDAAVAGTFAWTGGLLAGTGLLDIGPGGSLISNPGAVLVMQDRTLRNRSDIGIDLVDVQLALNGAAVLDNQGRMRIEHSPDGSVNFSGTGSVLNVGSFELTSASITNIANRFDNSGTLTLNSGRLHLNGGGTHSGSFLMIGSQDSPTAGRLLFRGTHTLGATSSITGARLDINAGTTTIDGSVDLESLWVSAGFGQTDPGRVIVNSDIELDSLRLNDSNPVDELMPTLTGTGNISVTTSFVWEGGTIGGSGILTIADAVQLTQFGLAPSSPAGTAVPLLTLSGRTLSSAATDVSLERARLEIIDGGAFENSGGLTFGSEGGMPFTIEGGANGTFRNTGTVISASDLVFGTTTQNSGTLQAPNLSLAASMTLTQNGGSISTPGTFNVGGDFLLLGGSVAATTTNVTGSLGGVGTITGNLNNAGILSPGTSPGELTIDGDFTQDDLGTLIIEVDGDASQPGVDFDLLTITGSASFDGTLELIALEGFGGTYSEDFQPITYTSATGGFARVVQPSEGDQFTPLFGPTGLTAQQGLTLNPDGTANIDPDNPPIPRDEAEAELIADAVARSRGTTQEQIETTNTTVTLSNEQQLVQDECAERLDRPDATGDSTGQGVGCRSM